MAGTSSSSIRPIQELHPDLSSLRMDSNEDESFVVLQEDVDGNVDFPSRLYDSLPPFNTSQTEDIRKLIEEQLKSIENNGKSEEVAGPSVASFETTNGFSGDNNMMHSKNWSDDIQKQVEVLVKENKLLKAESLAQNNSKLSSQKDKLLKWQEDVERINKAHKDKLLEAKVLIEKLEDDKKKLTADVDKLSEIRRLQDDELIDMKLQQKALTDSTTSTVLLNAESDANSKKIEGLNDRIADLDRLLELTRLDNVRLQVENERLEQSTSDNEDLSQKLSEAEQTIEALDLKLNVSNKENRIYQKENDGLKRQVDELKCEILGSEGKFVPNLTDQCCQLREQLAAAQMTVTELRERLRSKDRSLKEMAGELEAKKTDLEEVEVLRQQLDVYKQDFEDERTAKSGFKQERDQLIEDLQNLQRRNGQLQEELEVVRENRNFHVLPPAQSSSAKRSMGAQEVFSCPKCNFGFNNYQALDNHVHRCLDLMDSLP